MITGIVQEVINNGLGKGSGIRIDGVKYGAYDPVKAGIDVIAVGDEVSLEFQQKGQYKNIMGRVNKTGNTGTPAPATPSSSGSGTYQPKKGGYSRGVFPIPATDGQRSIIRQNSITNAVATVTAFVAKDSTDAFGAAKLIVEVAQIFEEYSAGDMDEAAATAAVAAMSQTDE